MKIESKISLFNAWFFCEKVKKHKSDRTAMGGQVFPLIFYISVPKFVDRCQMPLLRLLLFHFYKANFAQIAPIHQSE